MLQLNPLELRKQLLIAESEINREELMKEWQAMTDGVHELTDRAKTFASLGSAATVFLAGAAAFRRGRSKSTETKTSWLQTGLKVAKAAGSIWLAFRARQR